VHTGLAVKDRRRLLGETATAAASAEPAALVEVAVAGLVGRNTFAAQGERSRETSNEQSNEVSNDLDRSSEHAPWDTAYGQADGGEEDGWTGTD